MPIKPENQTDNDTLIKEFVKGASVKTDIHDPNGLPWSGLDDTEKTKAINLRITKCDLAKLQYISKNTPFSIQAFVYQTMKEALEDKLNSLI